MTRDELKELVLRHMSLGFDYIDVDGWKIKPDSDDVNLLYCGIVYCWISPLVLDIF